MRILYPDLRSFEGGYTIAGERFRAVTPALRAYPADVDTWAQKVAASYAIDHAEELRQMTRQRALTRCAAEATMARDNASKVGKQVHAAIRSDLLGDAPRFTDNERGVDAKARFEQWKAWRARVAPNVWAAEAVVVNRRWNYAGAVDLIAEIDTVGTVLVDVKATNTIAARVAVQLAALRSAETIVGPDAEWPMPTIDRCAVLHLSADSARLVEIDAGPAAFRAFRALLDGVRPFHITEHDHVLGVINTVDIDPEQIDHEPESE